MNRWIIFLALAVAFAGASREIETVADLVEDDGLLGKPKTGVLSLVELREQALMTVRGQESMTEEMAQKAKRTFVSMAANFKSDAIRGDAIGTVRMAQHLLLGEGAKASSKAQGSGLDLIFRKLNELKKKIENEQAAEKKQNDGDNSGCDKFVKDNSNIITESTKQRKDNANTVSKASIDIKNDRAEWVESRQLEDDTEKSLRDLQGQRAEESDAIRARVNERNKGIDVMVKATFMVCERFNRYKDTKQCQEIKAQPDIDEPHRYETKPYDKAKEVTNEHHKKGGPWEEKWKKQEEKDHELQGKDDPEGLIKNPTNSSEEWMAQSKTAKTETEQLREAAASSDMVSLLSEEEGSSSHQGALSMSESQTYRELNLMTSEAKLPHRYAMPLTELAVSLKSGDTKRSKSIVEILLSVLKETREEQAVDKAKHQINLDKYFKQSWEHMDIMVKEAADQKALRARMEQNRLMIRERMGDNEDKRLNQNRAFAARTQKENSCGVVNEEFGVREALRLEDLENLAKLKSLLRALYDKKMPKACPKHNKQICTSKDNGWCIYVGKSPSNEQTCSCNVGFYGDACQFRMCPGGGKTLYKADSPGSCSDRGQCNPLTGTCNCGDAFYHGQEGADRYSKFYVGQQLNKNACEFKHTPNDLDGNPDTCSGPERGIADPIRGSCKCKEEFYGLACEQKKCPNSNGVLYPVISGSACNGRGACSVSSGKCTCMDKYSGGSCEFERCPGDCNGRGVQGQCDTITGHCACKADAQGRKTFGHSCEFIGCPSDCSGGGTCNRNDGVCLCKMGYSGAACEQTKRCTASNLNNKNMNWWTIWDKPGWLVCPKGQLMYQLRRSNCNALSCLDSGGCAAACEGDKHVFQLRHCYHDLRWYTSFDKAGTSECLPDYYVAGLFRSCESLYCLNMAKCCSLKEARWAKCTEKNWAATMAQVGTSKAPNANTFITGLKRDDGHQLKNIKAAKYCGFVRGY